MSLKKNLRRGQAALEYFILFAVIGGLTLIGVSTFLTQARNSAYGLLNTATEQIINSAN
jgi:hypothetical protein